MLEAFAKFGLFDISVIAAGDLQVDQHHTIEDIGFVLGQTFSKALGNRKGINRAGYFILPMDESLCIAAADINGRPYLQYKASFRRRYCGGFDTDTLEDFFYGFGIGCAANIVICTPYGRSDHHKTEAIFKAFGKAMKMACSIDPRASEEIPSTKGVIEMLCGSFAGKKISRKKMEADDDSNSGLWRWKPVQPSKCDGLPEG